MKSHMPKKADYAKSNNSHSDATALPFIIVIHLLNAYNNLK